MWYEPVLALDLLPDALLRRAIRARLGRHQAALERAAGDDPAAALERFAQTLRRQPVAVHTDAANEQHYEVPASFFRQFLGPRMKYSSCFWPHGVDDLAAAEEAMLRLTCERAGVADGMRILDLGCGWGSLSIYVAEHYPGSKVLAVSNSRSQGEYVRAEADRRGLEGIEHQVGDIATFDTERRFDRVISVEMLEHVRNYELAFGRIRSWLAPDGRCFVHVFRHRSFAYTFDGDDWMGRYFFTGGTMPAHDLFGQFDSDLRVVADWRLDGTHYARTLERWLVRLDAVRESVWPVLAETYGDANARRRWVDWRLFFMVCAEAFGLDEGRSYGVSHYLLESAPGSAG